MVVELFFGINKRVLITLISTLEWIKMEMKELYGGIDTHKENFAGCIVDEKGRVLREHSFPATREAVEKFTSGIPNSQMKIVIETCGIWRGAYNIFRELGYEVKLANPADDDARNRFQSYYYRVQNRRKRDPKQREEQWQGKC